jgi:hypothetical protein
VTKLSGLIDAITDHISFDSRITTALAPPCSAKCAAKSSALACEMLAIIKDAKNKCLTMVILLKVMGLIHCQSLRVQCLVSRCFEK